MFFLELGGRPTTAGEGLLQNKVPVLPPEDFDALLEGHDVFECPDRLGAPLGGLLLFGDLGLAPALLGARCPPLHFLILRIRRVAPSFHDVLFRTDRAQAVRRAAHALLADRRVGLRAARVVVVGQLLPGRDVL